MTAQRIAQLEAQTERLLAARDGVHDAKHSVEAGEDRKGRAVLQ